VKTNKKLTVLVLTIAFGFIIIAGSFQSDRAGEIPGKSVFLFPDVMSRSLQEESKYKYVGMEKCASVCHNNEVSGFQYDIMKKGPHAKAFEALASGKAMHYAKKAGIKENPQESLICLKCHITGAGLDSTFFASTYKREDGVTCEACHKGEYITKAFLPKEADCLKCHNNSIHRISGFDFKEKCAKIAHPKPKAKPKEV
jgi:Cytochrome c554 and c-prime